MFVNDDGSTNEDTICGAEGILAFQERADTSTEQYGDYMRSWDARASRDACVEEGAGVADGDATMETSSLSISERPFCDADGDTMTIASYSAFYADALLLYAHAIHTIFRTTDASSAALYAAIRGLAPFQGVSGTVSLDPSSADRLGSLALLNVQVH